MYCKMYVIANGAILKKKYICKILVELYSAILVRFSIFSIQVALIVRTGVQLYVPLILNLFIIFWFEIHRILLI